MPLHKKDLLLIIVIFVIIIVNVANLENNDSFDKNITINNKLKLDDTSRIQPPNENEPVIGMSEEELLNSNWGNPIRHFQTIPNGTNEQWLYSNNRCIYLDNGIVTSIKN